MVVIGQMSMDSSPINNIFLIEGFI